ncbi:MAG: DUF4270 domain-containing protein [Flavobacteriaceae bacterium]|nr:DUF4270 domain-containing protein [Flavobacteriaceae bacterium]
MTNKIINSAKYLLVFCVVFFGVISCEKDFENIGVNIVNNNLFDTEFQDFEVVAYSKNVDSSRVDGLPIYGIGVLNDDDFGILRSAFISQLGLPVGGIDFGLNPVIDTVILDIPYFATRQENNEDGTPNFTLDSIFGDADTSYQLEVNRLTTFLNTLDPQDPTRNKLYYSNESYTKGEQLYAESFEPDANDTVLYVTRSFFENEQRIDTILKEARNPSVKLGLDSDEFKRIFIDEITEAEAESPELFSNYFRGIIIEPQSDLGSLMFLSMNDANISIYYTNEVLTDETTVDLNGDGDTDDVNVPVKTKQTVVFPLSGIRAATYNRDYSSATELLAQFNAPDSINGHSKLFVQGAQGSIVELKLFDGIDLDSLNRIRQEGWLINGAVLELYLDDPEASRLPNRLYLYNAEQGVSILDHITEAPIGVDGNLITNEDDDPEDYFYRFFITDYISEVLKNDDPLELYKLAIKMYHPTEAPVSIVDTIVKNFSWNAQSVVIKGNNFDENDQDFDRRLKLRIYYTKTPE